MCGVESLLYTAKKRWLFQPCVGLFQLQALKHKVIIWFPLYNSTVMSCILRLMLSLGCVYRVHVSRVVGDVTCALIMIPLLHSQCHSHGPSVLCHAQSTCNSLVQWSHYLEDILRILHIL